MDTIHAIDEATPIARRLKRSSPANLPEQQSIWRSSWCRASESWCRNMLTGPPVSVFNNKCSTNKKVGQCMTSTVASPQRPESRSGAAVLPNVRPGSSALSVTSSPSHSVTGPLVRCTRTIAVDEDGRTPVRQRRHPARDSHRRRRWPDILTRQSFRARRR
jgi:hypothetical protein